ncbi:nucleolar protein 7 isoform X2 [Hippocampus comes]|uniref:nucleolar protein 7 isoform X2 n=1 Tax=Hippocampus comes TaxID=109280 RepID=UPI00094F31A4|nr:PREDICTED: nucleolar protein 7 isoform X2 [Hippocampus comes]
MAPKKRGVTDSLSKADSEEIMESWGLELGSSDDDAPDEVTFEDSKAQALRSVKQALENGRREKDLLKEKRKKRLELFQEQKKRKLISAKLLEEIDSSQQSQQEADTRHQDEDEDQKEKTKQKLKHSRMLKGNYEVTTVKPPTLASSQQKAAEDFLHSRLYGAGSCRTTSKRDAKFNFPCRLHFVVNFGMDAKAVKVA